MILALSIHYSRASDIIIPDYLTTDPSVPIGGYRDGFGNWCTRLVAPSGRIRIKTDALIRDTGQPDAIVADAQQNAVQDLPEETLVFLLGSRYCETDLLCRGSDAFLSLVAGMRPKAPSPQPSAKTLWRDSECGRTKCRSPVPPPLIRDSSGPILAVPSAGKRALIS
jgi:hypothetical protein